MLDRPSAGATPSVSKNPGVTTAPPICAGSPACVSVKFAHVRRHALEGRALAAPVVEVRIRADVLVVFDGDGRDVAFRQRAERPQLLALVSAGLLHSTSLVEIAFDAYDGECDDVLLAFAADVAALCTFAAGVGVSVAMLVLIDEEGALARRIIPQPVTARYREREVVPDFLLPRLFPNAFAEYRRMKQAHAPWGKLASYCASLEDPPYLEQKFSSLITAVEFFVRNCLIERGQPEEEVTKLEFPS